MKKKTISVPTVKPRNAAAKDLFSGKYNMKTVQSFKAYTRKDKHKKTDPD